MPEEEEGDAFEGLSESFPGAGRKHNRPDTWEFDATPGPDEEPAPEEPGSEAEPAFPREEPAPEIDVAPAEPEPELEVKEERSSDLTPDMEAELEAFLGEDKKAAQSPEMESALPEFLGHSRSESTTKSERAPSKPTLSREERRLLPASFGPGNPPSLLLRIMDPAQLRRALDLTINERRAVFRVRPTDKLEPGDPVKIFLSLPGGTYLELEGLVYEDPAPGTHMVVEPLEEGDFQSIWEAWEAR